MINDADRRGSSSPTCGGPEDALPIPLPWDRPIGKFRSYDDSHRAGGGSLPQALESPKIEDRVVLVRG
jgi:hypothetical protein